MLLLIASMLLADPAPDAFPERSPALIEACLTNAIEIGEVNETDDSHKYMCVDEAADRLWGFLAKAKVRSWEQDVGADGVWLSRNFPLGGCFKRIRMADGSRLKPGLSCSVWIPRAKRND
ncbi:MAG TPA: hypothetical protein VGB04_06195 [Allosphingosinicella sp.]|jgi:hypothetical protein